MIREANKQDLKGIAMVHVDCWKTTYTGIVPDEFLDGMSYKNSENIFSNIFNNKTEDEIIYVADLNGKVIGYAYAGTGRNEKTENKGELYSIYILEKYQSMKIGRKLLSSISQAFLKNGIDNMYVEVLSDNTAKNFYEHMGAKKISEKYIDRIAGVKLKELTYGWDNIRILV